MLFVSVIQCACAFPSVASQMSNAVAAIRYLDLSGNRLASLAGLTHLPVLHTLLLSGNCISSLAGCGTAAFPCLETLDVSFNGLQPQSIPQLGMLPQLRQLDVSGADAMFLPGTCTELTVHQYWYSHSSNTSQIPASEFVCTPLCVSCAPVASASMQKSWAARADETCAWQMHVAS